MNRRTFFSTLLAGLASAPMVAAARDSGAIRRPGVVSRLQLPPEMGPVTSMAHMKDHIFLATKDGVWTVPVSELNKK